MSPPDRDDAKDPGAGKPQGEGEERATTDTAVSALRSVGAALGGWARRVGTIITDATQTSGNEEQRAALAEIAELRLRGRFTSARERLRTLMQERPGDVALTTSFGLTVIAEAIADQRPTPALAELIDGMAKTKSRPAVLPLLEATQRLFRREGDQALDALRRGLRAVEELPQAVRGEARFFLHFLATMAQASRGRYDRALLELHKARASVPEGMSGGLQRRLLLEGVAVLLAEDHLDEAAAWVTPLASAEPGEGESIDELTLLARGLLARTVAAKGDHDGAHALADDLPEEPGWDAIKIRVGLACGGGVATRDRAMRHLQALPEEWQRSRLWALAEVTTWPSRQGPLPESLTSSVMDALVNAIEAAPPGLRDGFIHELAHVLLRADVFPEAALAVIFRRLGKEGDTAAEEVRLVRARHRLRRGEVHEATEDFVDLAAPRFRIQPDLGGPWGPDEVSPLRDPIIRLQTLRSQRALAAAEYSLRQDLTDHAQELLVEALAEAPNLGAARQLLTQIARPPRSSRLEDLLAGATSVLAALPSSVLGTPLTGVQRALGLVIAARERLARPLTIAVMGEFSSGKSTFVNALLGEPIAPMGVLPTTTTINLFRRGPTGGARIYYRDDRVATLARGDVHNFLHALDDVEASRIRHVEIERTGARMGDAAVVDTPGLNALDAFHERVAREFIDEADAVIWVFSATRGSTASEAGMLSTLRADGRQVLGVLNKVDTLEEEERTELSEYLHDQLGEVLVDIVPVCASEALKVRAGESTGAEHDPFSAVEEALENHFLRRARELKRTLTARRLADALTMTRHAIESAATTLEAAADGAASHDSQGLARDTQRLVDFGARVHGAVLELDDLLVRECLALGIFRSGAGMTRETLGAQDSWYLTTVVRDSMLKALQAALGDLSREDDAEIVYDVLTNHLIPWACGYLDALGGSGTLVRLIVEHGPAIAKGGEAAVRERLRTALLPMAAAWQKFVVSLDRPLRQAQAQAHRRAATRPRAEALRLRTIVISGLDALLASVAEVQG
ncbi:MAG: dynamin family protein [Nannocystaceae bacterium]